MTRTQPLCSMAYAPAASFTIISGASPSQNIATSLIGYRLDAVQSPCIGERLERSPPIDKLQELGRAARACSQRHEAAGRVIASDMAQVASQFNSAKLPIEVARAPAGSGVLTG